MEEIENLYHKDVSQNTLYDIRRILDFFANDIDSKYTEVYMSEAKGHIDRDIVEYAKKHSCEIITADKGMCVWCRFYGVPFERLERKNLKTELNYIKEYEGNYFVYLREVPFDSSVFVIDPAEQLKSDRGSARVPIDVGDYILTATLNEEKCLIRKYIVKEEEIKKVTEEYYSDSCDCLAKKLYQKWCRYMNRE